MRRPLLRRSPRSVRRQRGAIAVMVAVTMLVILAAIGLVVDGGLAYLVKARLNAAVDSAALAGARAVTNGANQTEQTANAQAAAQLYFDANIPPTLLAAAPKLTTKVTFNAGTAIIDTSATAKMPVSMMQVLGFTELAPVAYAQTTRRDLDMAFVVDTSGSLQDSGSDVQIAAKTFLNQFNVTQDRVALIHFASGVKTDNPIATSARGFNRASMLSNIDSFVFSGGTSSAEGLYTARDQLNSIPATNRSAMRVIVFFSDGAPTSFFTTLKFDNASDCKLLTTSYVGSLDSTGLGMFRTDVSDDTPHPVTSCNFSYRSSKAPYVFNVASTLPDWYSGHDATQREIPIVTNTPRVVTNDVSTDGIAQQNIDRASRNLAEAMANKARSEGVFVLTLGLGAALKTKSKYDAETGEDVLKCLANVANGPSRCYNPNLPVGMYCYAATTADLTPCFSRLASAILRISK